MVCIELRNDGWFDIGKEYADTPPVLRKLYEERQKIKSALETIGEQPTIEDLKKKVSGIKLTEIESDGAPYVTFLGKDTTGRHEVCGTYVGREGMHSGLLGKVRDYV